MAHNRERFNCRACQNHRHCDDSNPAPFPLFVLDEIGLESRTCLLPMITDESRMLMQLYSHYKNGNLPYDGGILDQPAGFGEAMAHIDAMIAKEKASQ